jgi:membrane protease YdiL (CAAX protease family)
MGAWLMNTVKRWPAATFCVLVYGLVWLLFLAFRGSATLTVALLIGSWLPNLVGLLVTAVAEGRPGVRRLLARFGIWRVRVKWYAAALLLPATTVLLATGLHVLAGNPAPTAIPANALLPAALFNLILGPLGEELGWRGTLLPRLRTRQGVLTAGLLVGLIWGPFHLPAWLIPDSPQAEVPVLAFLLSAVAFSVFLSWLFDRTGGSLLLTCLAHWAINFAGSSSGIYGVPAILWLWTAVWWIVVATIFVLERGCLAHRETRGLQGIP